LFYLVQKKNAKLFDERVFYTSRKLEMEGRQIGINERKREKARIRGSGKE